MLRQRYAAHMQRHRLKREIVATVVANTMINRTGSVFVHRMLEETGAPAEDVARAYILVRDIFGLEELWGEIDALDNKAPGARAVRDADRGRAPGGARGAVVPAPAPRAAADRAGAGHLPPGARDAPRPGARDSVDWRPRRVVGARSRSSSRRRAAGVAERVSSLARSTRPRRDRGALEQKKRVESVAALYFALVGELELRWFADRITQLPTDTSWQALARNALRDDLSSQQRALASTVAKLSDSTDPEKMLAVWKERYAPAIARLKAMVEELKRQGTLDLAVLSVLLRELRTLA
jgi:glutamate dehydrogenase